MTLPPEADPLVAEFAQTSAGYYSREFGYLADQNRPKPRLNLAATLFGVVWLGARALWAAFWPAFFISLASVSLLAIAVFGDPGAEARARADRLETQAAERLLTAEAAIAAGDPLGEGMKRSAEGIANAAANAREEAGAATSRRVGYAALGATGLVLVHLTTGLWGTQLLNRRFRHWRADRSLAHGLPAGRTLFVTGFVLVSGIISAWRFAFADAPGWLRSFPSSPLLYNESARWLDWLFKATAEALSGVFRSISAAINTILGVLELGLVATPWPIVAAGVTIIAWQCAGRRVAIFTALALAYLAFFGFWEKSMATVALLGTAAVLCVIIGIPLGIWAGRNRRVLNAMRPVLDLMQTMPAFVYLIPVIAFFGIGKPPGIIATIIFGMPPVIRLTALGIASVPENIREAATAFGASRRFLLFQIDLPLARPSIMAGINQTLLMCLSMVVIASLIGARGLGEDVLSALQYAAVGKGILAGLAILACAMVIDRIVQGRSR